MLRTPELTPVLPLDDNERRVDSEQIAAMREQLDDWLLTPDLTDEQRDVIAAEVVQRIDNQLQVKAPPSMMEGIEAREWLAAVVGNTEYDTDWSITATHQQALKYFSGALIEAIRAKSNEADDTSSRDLAGYIYGSYFEGSPNIATYTGGISGQLELLSYINRSPITQEYLTQNIEGEAIYNGTFSGDKNIFEEHITHASPIAQLELINTASDLAKKAIWQGEWATPFTEKVQNDLHNIAEKHPDLRPFVRIAASVKAEGTSNQVAREWVDLDSLPYEQQERLLAAHESREEQNAVLQTALHEQFPKAGTGVLERVASDAAAGLRYGSVDRVTTIDGKQVQLTDISAQNDLAFTEEDAMLLKALYDPGMRVAVEGELGLDLSRLSLETQRHLLAFMVEAEPERYNRLIQALDIAGSYRVQLAEAFLAAKFGKDFGDTIISVAEKLDASEIVPLLESIANVRQEASRFATLFTDFDSHLELEISNAIGERVTEALYVIEELKNSPNSVATARVLKKRMTVDSVARVQQAIDYMARGLQGINDDVSSGVVANAYTSLSSTGWNLGDKKRTFLQLKPYGSPRGEYMQGVEHSEEGQINFSVNVSDAPEEVPYEIADYRRRYALSIRVDLEGTLRDHNGGKIGFDATRDTLNAALDLGSMRAQEDNPNYIVGSVISLGRKLRQKGKSRGYHTNLDERYGNKEVFAGMVEYTKHKLTRENSSRPSPHPIVSLGRIAYQRSASLSEKVAS